MSYPVSQLFSQLLKDLVDSPAWFCSLWNKNFISIDANILCYNTVLLIGVTADPILFSAQ